MVRTTAGRLRPGRAIKGECCSCEKGKTVAWVREELWRWSEVDRDRMSFRGRLSRIPKLEDWLRSAQEQEKPRIAV